MTKRAAGFVLFAVLISVGGAARASLVEGMPGATQDEQSIHWIWKHLGEIVRSCSAAPECQDPAVNKVVNELNSYLPGQAPLIDSPWAKLIQFASEKSNPSVFVTGVSEPHRVVVTQKLKMAPVIVNTDTMAMPLTQWVGILTHETVHHLGYDDDAKRLPDLVGAAVASHFEKNFSQADLSEFSHPEIRLGSFNSPAALMASPSMLIMGHFYQDISYGATPINPLCSVGETFVGEKIGAPLWRTSRIRALDGIVTMRAFGTAKIFCKGAAATPRTVLDSLHVGFDLHFPGAVDLTSPWWQKTSDADLATVVADIDDSAPELVNINNVFATQSIQYDHASLTAGQTLTATVNLTPLTSVAPQTCEIYLTGSKWSFHSYMSLPAVVLFKSCTVSKTAKGLQVTGTFDFPLDAQPDLFYIPLIRFPGNPDLFAVPTKPVVVQLNNPHAKPPLHMIAWRAVGLSPAPTLLGHPIKNSYRIVADQPFWVEADLQGSQAVQMEFLEFDLISEYAGQDVIRPASGRIDTLKPLVIGNQRVPIPGGVRLRYQMVLPSTMDIPTPGFRIRRFYVQSSDFSWTELESRSMLDSYFITDKLK